MTQKNDKTLEARFIKASENFDAEYQGNTAAPLFKKVFYVEKRGKAILSVCGLGYGYYYLNGKKVSDDLFTAPVSAYDKYVWYNEYDVTSLIKTGKNVIAVILGNGFFNENFPSFWRNNQAEWRDHPKVALSLEIDGEIILESDDSFLCTENSFVTHNQLRSGEHFDARLYNEKWKNIESEDSFNWKHAVIDKDFHPEFKKCLCEPIREIEYYDFIDCKKTDKGYVLDFGFNISGYISAYVNEREGTEIVFRHSEEIYPNGELKLNGLNSLYPTVDFQVDRYICGKNNYRWSPKFTYHGFRFVLVEGLTNAPEKGSIKAVFVHQNVRKISKFDSSNDLINKIYDAGIRATYSNLFYSLTDCPTREKFGWMNDAQASFEQLYINFDIKKFMDKWGEDILYSQTESGEIPAIVPTHGYGLKHGPVADGALYELPYIEWLYTGNADKMIHFLPYLEKYYTCFMNGETGGYWWLGDWNGNKNLIQEKEFLRWFYTIKFCKIISLAYELKGEEIPEKYFIDCKEAEKNILDRYIDSNGKCTEENLTVVSMIMHIGIADNTILSQQLCRIIEEGEFHLHCGMLGVQYLYDVLTDAGFAEYAFKLITAKEAPGFETWFAQGATTLWEKLEGDDHSRNHHMFSNVLAWFYKTLLGIHVIKAGYEQVEFKPSFINAMDYCNGSIETVRGKIEVCWERKDEIITYKIVLPKKIVGHFAGKELVSGVNVFKMEVSKNE